MRTRWAAAAVAVAGSIPGHEIEHPMAIVILGGLITSTLLNLFVLAASATGAMRSAAASHGQQSPAIRG